MFGLTFDKLLLIAVIAGFLLGPHRLPAYAQKLGETVRALRAFAESARVKAESELNISLPAATVQSLDIRQYDPRRIVRDALNTPTDAASREETGENREA